MFFLRRSSRNDCNKLLHNTHHKQFNNLKRQIWGQNSRHFGRKLTPNWVTILTPFYKNGDFARTIHQKWKMCIINIYDVKRLSIFKNLYSIEVECPFPPCRRAHIDTKLTSFARPQNPKMAILRGPFAKNWIC